MIQRIYRIGCPARVVIRWLLCCGILAIVSYSIGAPGALDIPSISLSKYGEQFPARGQWEAVALETAIDADSYILGPGDELTVVVWGDLEASFEIQVNPDGTVVIPTVGSMKVAGLSLTAATDSIIDMVREPYRADEVTVALTKVRTFLVSVGGAVNLPGTVKIHAGERANAAIKGAEGFLYGPQSEYDTTSVLQASPRLIRIHRADGEIVPVDLVLFLRTGKKEANPYLLDGDVIEVPFQVLLGSRIGIFGAFGMSGIYDYAGGDRLSTAVQLGGGLSSACDISKATLARFTDDSTWTELSIDLESVLKAPGGASDLALLPGDRLFVPWKPNWRLLHQVHVEGQVTYPGSYPIVLGQTMLSEVVLKAGGLLPDADLDRSRVIRTSSPQRWDHELSRLTLPVSQELDPMEKEYRKFNLRHAENLVVVDFEALFSGRDLSHDILLVDGDVIRIPQRTPSVRVLGQVMYPGYICWEPGLTYRDYISRAGGFAARADRCRIRMIRGQSDSWTKASSGIEIHAGDTIFIPEKTLHEKQTTWRYVIEAVALLTQVATLVLVLQNLKE